MDTFRPPEPETLKKHSACGSLDPAQTSMKSWTVVSHPAQNRANQTGSKSGTKTIPQCQDSKTWLAYRDPSI